MSQDHLSRTSSEARIENEAKEYLSQQGIVSDSEDPPRANQGGFKFTNHEEIREQRRGIWDFVRSVGSNVFNAQNIVNVSLPVYIFEPRSFLQRITDNWVYLPSFLPKAADAQDPVERLLNVVAFGVSGLTATCIAKKPFNPILGETYQASYTEAGCDVFMEQVSHHPPISAFLVKGKDNKFKLQGHAEWAASVRGNALRGQQLGPNVVTFNDGTVIEWKLPPLWLSGILWGDRTMDYTEQMTFTDKKNNLECTVIFNPDKKGFLSGLFTRQTSPTDTVRGQVKKNGEVIGTVEGSWLSKLDFVTKQKRRNLWNRSEYRRGNLQPVANPLPSDCRFREDLIQLSKGDVDGAQQWKEKLEDNQRQERYLRKQRVEQDSQ
eukprot:gb/GECH01011985.1/.p1 GENE.gb/GECH01011985.1/~~gb/GECH01011985.1/.p1  ORF type:complete len:378 (+),score=72.54 gb/GECH01011985.1/:1-1134(+)